MIALLRIMIKGPTVATSVLLFFVLGIINKIIFYPFPKIRKTLAQRNTQWTAWVCRHLIGYYGKYEITNVPQGHLLICNHMSYMDVLVIASKIPTLFVTSVEMKNTPFLGWITQIGECLYVNRRSHKNLNQEIQVIQSWLKNGFNVLIFPEATTSDGTKLRPFKSSLLQLAENNSIPLTAYCLKYTHLNSKPSTPVDMIKTISWYENAGFLPHVFLQFAHKNVMFKLKEVGHLNSSDYPDRKSLVHKLEELISNEFFS